MSDWYAGNEPQAAAPSETTIPVPAYVDAPVRQRRRWPWVLLGLMLGGGGNETVRTVTATDTVWAQPAFAVELTPGCEGCDAVGSLGIWDEGTEFARHRIFLQAGTIVFTVTDSREADVAGWIATVETDAPFTVVDTSDSWLVVSGDSARYAISLNRCDRTDERSWPVTFTTTGGDGGLIISETVEVVPQCGHPRYETDTTEKG